MKKMFISVFILFCLSLIISCNHNVNAELKNKWVDDDDTIQITYTFSDNKEGAVKLEFDLFGDVVIDGTFNTTKEGNLHLNLSTVKRNDTTTTIKALTETAAKFGITLPVKEEMNYAYTIAVNALTLTNLEDKSERNCTLAFSTDDICGEWQRKYYYYSGKGADKTDDSRVYTFNEDGTAKYVDGTVEINGIWTMNNNVLSFSVTSGTKNGTAITADDLSSYSENISFNNNKVAVNNNVFYSYDSSTAAMTIFVDTKTKELSNPSKLSLAGKWRTSVKDGLFSETKNYYYNFKKGGDVDFKENDTMYKGKWSLKDGTLSITEVEKYNTETSAWDGSQPNLEFTAKSAKSYLTLTKDGKTLHFAKQ